MILQLREGLREHLLVLYHTIRWSFVELRKNLRFFLSELVSGFCRRSEGPKGQAGICFMVADGQKDVEKLLVGEAGPGLGLSRVDGDQSEDSKALQGAAEGYRKASEGV
mmetsp:Transcript_14894/g.60735  ORF Transcript_14894/g.60735 Transcript_14894/m.60735 type:complete len:109 (+) Transcript_14894:6744-7070(+)